MGRSRRFSFSSSSQNRISRRAINHADTSDDALLNRFLVNRNSRDIITLRGDGAWPGCRRLVVLGRPCA